MLPPNQVYENSFVGLMFCIIPWINLKELATDTANPPEGGLDLDALGL